MGVRRLARAHPWATVTVAAAAPLLASVLLALVRDRVTSATGALVLVAIVVAAGATGLRSAGLAAALSAAASFDFFLVEPYGSFAITDSNDIEVTVLLLLIGAIVTETALWGLRQEARLGQETGYLKGVLAAAETISLHDRPIAEVADAVARQITQVLSIDGCRFSEGTVVDPRNPVLQHDGTLISGPRSINVDREGMPVDTEVVLPVRIGGVMAGSFLLTAATRVARPSLEQRQVAVLLADQLAGALSQGPKRRSDDGVGRNPCS